MKLLFNKKLRGINKSLKTEINEAKNTGIWEEYPYHDVNISESYKELFSKYKITTLQGLPVIFVPDEEVAPYAGCLNVKSYED